MKCVALYSLLATDQTGIAEIKKTEEEKSLLLDP
jgi:hypothetical protein